MSRSSGTGRTGGDAGGRGGLTGGGTSIVIISFEKKMLFTMCTFVYVDLGDSTT